MSEQIRLSSFPSRKGQATTAVRSGLTSDTQHGAVVPPIHLSSNYTFEGLGQPRQYDYTRSGNPTRDLLGKALAELEGGARGVVTATGMGAVHVVLQLLKPWELVLAPIDCYGGTHRLLTAGANKGSFLVEWVDYLDPVSVAEAIEKNPKLVWIETPSNPLLRITDVVEVAGQARSQGALVVVDNTFLSPALQRPLELGADIVVHSTTKYLNGHSDVVGGAVITKTEELGEEIAWWANCIGITGSPFDSYLTLRGVRTLSARLEHHECNARAIADELSSSPAVAVVYYPGLSDHPGHEVAKRQQDGFGAMLSFELVGDDLEAVEVFLEGLRYFTLAESLGGVESLIAHPATMTHAAMGAEGRALAGISDRLLRLSVGIENTEDLLADLRAGLDRVEALEARRVASAPAVRVG